MDNTKNKKTGIFIGTSLILVTFVLLCLVTFAALSYATAESDLRFSLQSVNRKKTYLDACSLAEQRLCNIDHALAELFASTNSALECEARTRTCLIENGCTFEEDKKGELYSFTVPFDSEQLVVKFRPAKLYESITTHYHIVSYHTEQLPVVTDTRKELIYDNR